MKRTTASLLTGALAAGGSVAIAVLTPGIAAAGGCGTTVLDENVFPQRFIDADLVNGQSTVVDGGLRVKTTTASDKASGAYLVDALPLADYTASTNYAYEYDLVSGTGPGYNLIVDIDGGDRRTGYTTLVMENGLYGEKFWTNSAAVQGVPAGSGYAHLGTIQEYSDANPEAVILGFGYSLGRGPAGEAVIDSITFGCNTFESDLANRAPAAALRIDNGGDSNYQTYWLSGVGSTDPDGDKLTYTFKVDGVAVANPENKAEFLHTFPKGKKSYQVTLTVSDGEFETTTAPQQVDVQPRVDTVGSPLASTGADVTGLAALGGLVVAGSAAGLIANRRRKGADVA